MGVSTPRGTPPRSSSVSAVPALPSLCSAVDTGSPSRIVVAATSSGESTASPTSRDIRGLRTTNPAHRRHTAPDGTPRPRRGHSSTFPIEASSTGTNDSVTRVLTRGINMLPSPMLRMNGTGSTIRVPRPPATVRPLKTTARPADSMARWMASSADIPSVRRSSRHRLTSSRE